MILVCVESCKERRCRPWWTWLEVVRKDMKKFGITSKAALDRNTWWMNIHKADLDSEESVGWLSLC